VGLSSKVVELEHEELGQDLASELVDSGPDTCCRDVEKLLLVGLELLPKHCSFVQIFAERKSARLVGMRSSIQE
jgi:hypothetical protein